LEFGLNSNLRWCNHPIFFTAMAAGGLTATPSEENLVILTITRVRIRASMVWQAANCQHPRLKAKGSQYSVILQSPATHPEETLHG
jgi:hypothetical protein